MRIFAHLLLALLLCIPSLADAAGPYQVPPRSADGSANLIYHWIEGGGARLYWQSVQTPKQVRLNGASFHDPAAYPLLSMEDKHPRYKKQVRKKGGKRKVARGKKGTQVAGKKAVKELKKPVETAQAKDTAKPVTDQIFLAPGAETTTVGENVQKPVAAPPARAADPVGSIPAEPLQ